MWRHSVNVVCDHVWPGVTLCDPVWPCVTRVTQCVTYVAKYGSVHKKYNGVYVAEICGGECVRTAEQHLQMLQSGAELRRMLRNYRVCSVRSRECGINMENVCSCSLNTSKSIMIALKPLIYNSKRSECEMNMENRLKALIYNCGWNNTKPMWQALQMSAKTELFQTQS